MGMKQKRIVIIGAGFTGTKVATRVRRCSAEMDITLVEEGEYLGYRKPGMHHYVSGKVTEKSKLFSKEISVWPASTRLPSSVNIRSTLPGIFALIFALFTASTAPTARIVDLMPERSTGATFTLTAKSDSASEASADFSALFEHPAKEKAAQSTSRHFAPHAAVARFLAFSHMTKTHP